MGQPSLEFIAAQGLAERNAHALAADLRAIGLSTMVCPGTGMERSALLKQARLSNAALVALSGGMVLPMGTLIGMPDGLLAALIPMVIAIANVLPMVRSGERLVHVGLPVQAGSLSARVLALQADLPQALLSELLTQARALERHAEQHPGGKVAAAVRTLTDQLAAEQDRTQRAQVDTLQQELTRIQRAASETQNRQSR